MGWSGPQVCVSAPLPHGRSWCRGMVVNGLGECPGIAYFTPKFGLEMYEKESGLSGEGIEGVCVPPPCCPCPFGSFLWVCPQKEGGQGRGKQSWSEPCRCGVSLGTLRCTTAARLGGLGGHNSFLGCEDPLALPGGFGQAHSPSNTTRSMHLPSLLPRLGGSGLHSPLLLGQGLNLVPRRDSHTQQPNSCSMQLWGDRPLPLPVFGMHISRSRTKAGPTGPQRDTASSGAAVGRALQSQGLTGGCKGSGTAGETAEDAARMLRGCCEDAAGLIIRSLPHPDWLHRRRRRLHGHKSGVGAGGCRVRQAPRAPLQGHQPAWPCHHHR